MSYIAFDCVVTAWSLVDWTYRALTVEQRVRLAGDSKESTHTPSAFVELVKRRISGLDICRQLSVGAKHFDVRKDAMADLSTAILEVGVRERRLDGSIERKGINYWPSVYLPDLGTIFVDELLAEVAVGWARLLDEEMIDRVHSE